MWRRTFPFNLIGKNNEGYKNITLLLSKAYERGYAEVPYIDQQWLVEHRAGVIILSGGVNGDVGKKLLRSNTDELKSAVDFYREFSVIIFILPLPAPVVLMKNVIFKPR